MFLGSWYTFSCLSSSQKTYLAHPFSECIFATTVLSNGITSGRLFTVPVFQQLPWNSDLSTRQVILSGLGATSGYSEHYSTLWHLFHVSGKWVNDLAQRNLRLAPGSHHETTAKGEMSRLWAFLRWNSDVRDGIKCGSFDWWSLWMWLSVSCGAHNPDLTARFVYHKTKEGILSEAWKEVSLPYKVCEVNSFQDILQNL